jgi:hypothetical protein
MEKIDIWDLDYVETHEELITTRQKAQYSSNVFKIFVGELILFYRMICHLKYVLYHPQINVENCKFAFFPFTGNNYRALHSVQEKLNNAFSFSVNDIFPLDRISLYALIYSPVVFGKYLISSGFQKKAYCSKFVNLCKSFGYYIEAEKFLKKIKPEFVIVANDHSTPQRSCFRVAQKLGIKTIYIQHASVTENFPSLEFDYAFLDGQESLDKYTAKKKMCKSMVFLSGNPRFDIIKSLNPTTFEKENAIRCGIAINQNDNFKKIQGLIHILQKNIKNIIITIRPHPLMDSDFWNIFSNNNHIYFSNSITENPFLFINKNDIFISGESAFHLDAMLSRKKSYYYNFTDDRILDWYGYLKSGLVRDITSYSHPKIKEILVQEHEINIPLLRYYISNFETSYWGNSADLIAETISQLAQFKIPDFWKQINNRIYELK